MEAFEFKNRWWVFFGAAILQAILFLACFYFYATYFDKPNRLAFFLIFVSFLLLSFILIRGIAKKFRFKSLGKLLLIDNQIFQSKSRNKIPVLNNVDLKVKYAGDKYWKSSFKPLMFFKQLFRYDHLWHTPNLNESFDYLEADGKRIYVKIKNETDKQAFLELVDKLQQLKPDLKKIIK